MPRSRRPRRRRRRPSRVAAAARPFVRPSASARSTASSARRSPPTTCRRCSIPIGYTVSGDGRRAHGGPADVATRQHRGDRRHRGGRPALRLRPRRQAAADVDRPRPAVGPPAAPAPAARRAARSRDHRGDAEPVPRPRHARRAPGSTATRCASPTRWSTDESVLRTSLRPGLLRAIAFNESHRRPGVALFEIGHVYPPGPGELPDEHEALGVVLAGRGGARSRRRVARGRRGAGRRRAHRPGPRAAGLHATRSATLQSPGADVIGAVGEVAPDVLEAFDDHRARRRPRARPRPSCSASEPKPAQWKPTSRHPSSDLDLAFVLADDVPAEKLDKAIRQGAGDAARRPRAVRRVPRRRGRRGTRAASPTGCGCRRPIAT